MRLFEEGAMRVKICGITNPADAHSAIDAGVDGLGFNFVPESKRYVAPDRALRWIRGLPDVVTRVAVVANPLPQLLALLCEARVFDAIQFHGSEEPEFCAASVSGLWIKALRISGPGIVGMAERYDTPYLLIDSFSRAGFGGTGEVADWKVAAGVCAALATRHVFLAGGLTPENVAAAVAAVSPHGVDVASGVEAAGNPRQKDVAKMRTFVARAKAARGGPRMEVAEGTGML